MLEGAGLQVTATETASEALDLLAQKSFDVVLMDLHLPGMDGLEATRRLRRMEQGRRRTPVIALTASVLPDDRAACREAGMDDFVGKPFRKKQLLVAVLRAVRRSRGAA